MTALRRRSLATLLAISLALVGCSDDDEIPGSTVPDEMTPDTEVLVPTTEGPATIPATTAAG